MDKWKIFNELENAIGTSALLRGLVDAMSTEEAMENFKHIAKAYDIDGIFDDEED